MNIICYRNKFRAGENWNLEFLYIRKADITIPLLISPQLVEDNSFYYVPHDSCNFEFSY